MWHSYKHSTYQKQQQYLSYSLGSCASVLLWLACHPTNTCLEEPWESKLWWHLGQLSYGLISELVPRQSKLRKLQVSQSTWYLTVMHFSLLQAQRQKLKWSDQGMNCPGQVCGCTCYSTAQCVVRHLTTQHPNRFSWWWLTRLLLQVYQCCPYKLFQGLGVAPVSLWFTTDMSGFHVHPNTDN